FLLATKCLSTLFGNSEMVLRALPFVSGLSALGLFWLLAARTIAAGAVPIAVVLFAASGPLIYYSSEFKPYSSDVAWTLGLYLLALRIRRRSFETGPTLLYSLVGACSLWFSNVTVFVLAGTSVVLAWELATRRRRDLAR